MKTILGVFLDRMSADSAIERLENLGYDPKDISIIVKDGSHIQEIRGSKGGTAASTMVTGATAGGVIGGLTGLLIGLGALTIPGVGAFLIGGPIAAALGLTGAAASAVSGATTGILAGGLVGGLVGLGIPEDVARVYEEHVREGAILLAVPARTTQDINKVREIFTDYDAQQVRAIGELRRLD